MKTSKSPFIIMYDLPKESHGAPGSVLYDLEELESVLIQDIQAPSPALAHWEKTMLRRSERTEDAAESLASLEELAVKDLTANSVPLKNRFWLSASRKMAALLESAEARFSYSPDNHFQYSHEPAA